MSRSLQDKTNKLIKEISQDQEKLELKEYDFLSLQSSEFQEIYYMYLDLKAAGSDDQAIRGALAVKIQRLWEIPEGAAALLAKNMCEKFADQKFLTRFLDEQNCVCNLCEQVKNFELDEPAGSGQKASEVEPKAFLTSLDYERFLTFTSVDPNADTDLKAALLSFIVNYRRNYHKSGWIKYDRKNILYLANVMSLGNKAQNDILGRLHADYGLEMRVVGSNNPTPCYKIDWLFDQPQPGSHFNPFIEFGPLVPRSIQMVATGELNLTPFIKKAMRGGKEEKNKKGE